MGSSCPDENELVDYAQGRLPHSAKASLEAHLDRCGTCRKTVAAMVEESLTPSPGEPSSTGALDLRRGTVVGRYLILDLLGAGGMSVVYAAYDPSLERKVALKFLRPEVVNEASGGQARLLREAKALARLTHPGAVAVYDAGTFGESIFIALEHVRGQDLRQWMNARARGWGELLEVFRQAGEGLAAAHDVGIVHRDFKPENVLVGTDGRVRVTDFGLARQFSEDDRTPVAVPGDASPDAVTRTGALVGTPAYMAPEQLVGARADIRSDQFSFCVSLHEALFGARPFGGKTVEELTRAIRAGEIRTPPGRKVPRWLQRAICRGLSANPVDRYRSMGELLAALRPRRRQWAVWSTGAITAVSLGIAALMLWRATPEITCRRAGSEMSTSWERARPLVAAAFQKLPAGPVAAQVESGLSAYAERWAAMAVDSCEATRVRGTQSAELMDLRSDCLRDAKREFETLCDLFSRADAELARGAPQALERLSPLDRCADGKSLSAPVRPPADPALRARIEEVRKSLAEIKALRAAARYPAALPRAAEAAAAARAIGYKPLEAEALYLLGDLQQQAADKGMEQTLREAILAADEARDDRSRAAAWAVLEFEASTKSDAEHTQEFAENVRTALARMGGDDSIEIQRLNGLATLDYVSGHYDQALALHERILALATKVLGPKSYRVGAALYSIGIDLDGAGKYDTAIPKLDAARAVWDQLIGEQTGEVAKVYAAVGVIRRNQQRYPEAIAAYRQAVALGEAALGPNHPIVAKFLSELGDGYNLNHQSREGLAAQQRALAIFETTLSKTDPDLAFPLTGTAEAYLDLGEPGPAIPLLERALSLRAGDNFPPEQKAAIQYDLAKALWNSGRDRRRATELARDAQRGFLKVPDRTQDELADIGQWLAQHR